MSSHIFKTNCKICICNSSYTLFFTVKSNFIKQSTSGRTMWFIFTKAFETQQNALLRVAF
ncbi:hypothetical protein B1J94_06880 [Leptospira kirschneri serovar Grippotyphosa]|nr:hypothetical protein B1J94_06880 [Leptospira kirschneri serovar Grippotyphosa]